MKHRFEMETSYLAQAIKPAPFSFREKRKKHQMKWRNFVLWSFLLMRSVYFRPW